MPATESSPLEIFARPMGVEIEELSEVSGEVFRSALADPPEPDPADERAVLIWAAGQLLRQVLKLDRGHPASVRISKEVA